MHLQGILTSLAGHAGLQNYLPGATNAGTQGTSSSGGSSSSNNGTVGLDDGDLNTTFLNLLVAELQNQDPTDPMDSTEMVGQMISLNQLDQLISINQAVTGSTSDPSSTSSGQSSGTTQSQAAGAHSVAAPPTSSANNLTTAAQSQKNLGLLSQPLTSSTSYSNPYLNPKFNSMIANTIATQGGR